MVKPVVQDRRANKARILEAAFAELAAKGYAALSMREIAKRAGVTHALINYHFRTKDQLVIEVLEAANRRLLERQRRMYGDAGGFAYKWAQARRFYADDLGGGFVRVQAELWAASMANRPLRKRLLPQLRAWRAIVLGGVRAAVAALERRGVALPSPFGTEVIAAWISAFWFGMEFLDLIAEPRDRRELTDALDAMQALLTRLDATVDPGSRRSDRGGGAGGDP